MALIGGSLTGPLVFILPPLIYSRIKKLEAERNRTPTQRIFSTKERRGGYDIIADPKVHSQSIHHGFKFDSETASTSRNSYIYYDNSSDLSDYSLEDDGNAFRQPVHLDVSKPIPEIRQQVNRSNRGRDEEGNFKRRFSDWFGYLVVFLGVILTISATYINIRNTIKFVEFTPPCIVNVSAAAKGLNVH